MTRQYVEPRPEMRPGKTPYETPRLETVELRPEEQLLGCIKINIVGPPPCPVILVS